MARYRIPLIVRALALFLASLPVARASAAELGAQSRQIHETKMPLAPIILESAPAFVSAGALVLATTQRSRAGVAQEAGARMGAAHAARPRAASAAGRRSFAPADAHPAAALEHLAQVPAALVISLPLHRNGAGSASAPVPTALRPRAP